MPSAGFPCTSSAIFGLFAGFSSVASLCVTSQRSDGVRRDYLTSQRSQRRRTKGSWRRGGSFAFFESTSLPCDSCFGPRCGVGRVDAANQRSQRLLCTTFHGGSARLEHRGKANTFEVHSQLDTVTH